MIINRSRYETFWGCPRRYYWEYIQNLTTTRTAPELRVGAAVHRFLELWHMQVDIEESLKEMHYDFDRSLHQIQDVPLAREFEDQLRAQAEVLCRDYVRRWHMDKSIEVIDTECQGDAPLPGGHSLRFRVDGMCVSEKMMWVWENKTTRWMGPQFVDSFMFNMQVIIYVYGAAAVLKQKLAGAIINILKKPQGKYTSDFMRQPIPVSAENMKSAMNSFAHTADLIMATDPENIYAWPQITKDCARCQFRPICAFGAEPIEPLFIKRKDDYVDEGELPTPQESHP